MRARYTTEVMVVGAGPVGLFTALSLANNGIEVAVRETLEVVRVVDVKRQVGRCPALRDLDAQRQGIDAHHRPCRTDDARHVLGQQTRPGPDVEHAFASRRGQASDEPLALLTPEEHSKPPPAKSDRAAGAPN